MNLTDSEIMMVEQLTYFGNIDAGDKGKTIEEILSEYTEDRLKAMETSSTSEDADRAAVIRYLQNSDNVKNLVLDDTMEDASGKRLALCFTEPGSEGEALVAFQGTTAKEWGDNVEGATVADTQRQIEALDYIESLPYDNITVTGHSKGGNKAMYVAITSDKVNRCVSMDGQGFSQEFMDKYAAEIEEKGQIISNYSIKTDYVHVLLFQPPGSNQISCEGYRIGKDIKRHHQPFTYFQIDENGQIVLDKDGKPLVTTKINGQPIQDDPSVVMIHGFTAFVMNIATPEDKEKIVNLIATLADMMMGEDSSMEEIQNYLLNNMDNLSLVLAYLVKYMDTYNLSSDEIDALLQCLGLNSLDEYFTVEVMGFKLCGLSDFLNVMLENITDGKPDHFINALLSVISGLLGFAGFNIDLKGFWEKTERKINSIGNVSQAEGKKEPNAGSGAVRDFSVEKYETLMRVLNRINNMGFDGVGGWGNYSSEDWYGPLLIGLLSRAISVYYSKLEETNEVCKERINKVFDAVEEIDNRALLANVGSTGEQALSSANFQTICNSLG